MEHVLERLSDLAGLKADVRIVCGKCGFEEDWNPDALRDCLAATGGSEAWPEITRHLRCRSFGYGSTDLHAIAVPQDRRPENMPRRIGRLDAHLLGAALGVLDAAARRSRGQAVATLELRLALLVVHRYWRRSVCVSYSPACLTCPAIGASRVRLSSATSVPRRREPKRR